MAFVSTRCHRFTGESVATWDESAIKRWFIGEYNLGAAIDLIRSMFRVWWLISYGYKAQIHGRGTCFVLFLFDLSAIAHRIAPSTAGAGNY